MVPFDGRFSINPSIVTIRWAQVSLLLMYEDLFQKTDLSKKDMEEKAKIELKMLKLT
jgi:hypothetical protein